MFGHRWIIVLILCNKLHTSCVRNHDKLGVFSKGTVLCGGCWPSKQGVYVNVITSKPNSKISQNGVAELKYHMCTYIKYFSNLSKNEA